MTVIGFGGGWIGKRLDGYSDDMAIETLHHALDLGVNLVDTAPLYDQSERRIGLGLEAWYAKGGKREDFILSTKTGTRTRPFDHSADSTKWSLEESLKLLKTDYLDIVLVHDPETLDQALGPDGALQALRELREQGVVRHIGLGVRDHHLHREFHATGECEVSLTYRDYNLIDQSARAGLLDSAETYDVGVFNAQVVRHGLLSGTDPLEVERKYRDKPGFEPGGTSFIPPAELARARQIWQWSREREIDLLGLNFQFCLRDPRVSTLLLGAATPAELDADVAAVTRPLPPDVWDELSSTLGVDIRC